MGAVRGYRYAPLLLETKSEVMPLRVKLLMRLKHLAWCTYRKVANKITGETVSSSNSAGVKTPTSDAG